MDSIELEKLMADVGPLVEAVEVRQYTPERWAIAFDEDFVVDIEHDTDAGKLVFYADLGQPLPGEENAVYKLLLYVATMWRETGGLRMGLNPGDDSVTQVYDFPLAGLEIEDLEIHLRNFAHSALHARKVLVTSEGTSSDSLEGLMHHIRV
jgi:hypothetical protein